MGLIKAVMVGTVVLSFAGATAHAADPLSEAPTRQTQQAAPANPPIPYSYTRLPGPKAGPSTWIPSSRPDQTSPNSSGDAGARPYSQKSAGF